MRLFSLLLLLLATGLQAQTPAPATPVPAPAPAPAAPLPPAPKFEVASSILMDFTTGQVLASQEADTRVEPASITKVMAA
ncbi:MAG: serine-type D-Ala-D-Ala carboxypeptidase, partial [Xanthomonadales bacterium]|nr:serine-type D-Ala-D-Ala carboxypeptidase [Xanthomonadales bacterium]